jgi:CubicO group peptidase (beta-lactamase class C family)
VRLALFPVIPDASGYWRPGRVSWSAIAVLIMMLLRFSPAKAQQAQLPKDFDAYVAQALKQFDMPGLAIAVVKDGHVVLAKGYGLRRLGDPTPVDAHTLFQIASNTKAFTTAALVMLVGEGKLRWDDPVTAYIPDFQLLDSVCH